MALRRECLAEFLGTYLLVGLGCGVVHVAVLTGSQAGLWQIAVVWGVAVTAAIYVAGAASGAHINPAMTLAFAMRGRFGWSGVAPYIASQVAGALAAAATLFLLFGPLLTAKETEKHVVRGGPGSEVTAMCYGEYFPSPGLWSGTAGAYDETSRRSFEALVSEPAACLAEALGTAILALVVFATTDDRNRGGPGHRFAPVIIGLTIAGLISVLAPLTQACFNPARDFGPRLFAYFAGWGQVAMPGRTPTGFLTVYVIAPIVGANVGAWLYDGCLRPALSVRSIELAATNMAAMNDAAI